MAMETWDGRAPRRIVGAKDPGNDAAFIRFLAYSDDHPDTPPGPLMLRVRDVVRVQTDADIPGASLVTLADGTYAVVHGTVDEVREHLAPARGSA